MNNVVPSLKQLLDLPAARGKDIDDPATTESRVDIIRNKRFLKNLYSEWYSFLQTAYKKNPPGLQVELGSGAGFFKDLVPDLITSDIMGLRNLDVVFAGEQMPFKDGELSGLHMVNVLHHIPRPEAFFKEAARCLKPGGRIAMIEPYNSVWGRWVWTHLHHEPFLPDAGWDLPGNGPLSDANGALPWILFERDRERFHASLPELTLGEIRPIMPLSYLISGGVSKRSFLPGMCYTPLRAVESALGPLNKYLGMFAYIELIRESPDA